MRRMRFTGQGRGQQLKAVKMYLVTWYKDDSDAVPCQDFMTAESLAALDDHKIAKAEEINADGYCTYPDCHCPADSPGTHGWCLIGKLRL